MKLMCLQELISNNICNFNRFHTTKNNVHKLYMMFNLVDNGNNI